MDNLTINPTDYMQSYYSEAKENYTVGDNAGSTCFKLEVEHDDNGQSPEEDARVLSEKICVSAKNTSPVELPSVPEEYNNIN